MGMKAKESVGVSVQGEKKLTDDELIALHRNCLWCDTGVCCKDCPYRGEDRCDIIMQRDIVGVIERLQSRIEELEEKKTVETAKERFLRMATLPQAEVDALFNAGRFNDIAVGYAKLAMVQLGYPFEKIQHVIKVMWQTFEDYRAESARTSSFVNAKGVRV